MAGIPPKGNIHMQKVIKTFGNWSYDPSDDTITFLPNDYYLHRDNPDFTVQFWIDHLNRKRWYGHPQDCADLHEALHYAGWK
jgi:hypothetical protein